MNIAYVLVQSTIGHEMEVLGDLLKIDFVWQTSKLLVFVEISVSRTKCLLWIDLIRSKVSEQSAAFYI